MEFSSKRKIKKKSQNSPRADGAIFWMWVCARDKLPLKRHRSLTTVFCWASRMWIAPANQTLLHRHNLNPRARLLRDFQTALQKDVSIFCSSAIGIDFWHGSNSHILGGENDLKHLERSLKWLVYTLKQFINRQFPAKSASAFQVNSNADFKGTSFCLQPLSHDSANPNFVSIHSQLFSCSH